jgi:hypothetical protein
MLADGFEYLGGCEGAIEDAVGHRPSGDVNCCRESGPPGPCPTLLPRTTFGFVNLSIRRLGTIGHLP